MITLQGRTVTAMVEGAEDRLFDGMECLTRSRSIRRIRIMSETHPPKARYASLFVTDLGMRSDNPLHSYLTQGHLEKLTRSEVLSPT
ncbi:hypothetical protein [Oceanomicrobium pacificus]|uniref:Uncharacterized protein n=1 Tax=Oceanomicrobium pacificus TaxID=2692916 RepID=A0A6B0TYA5_9RHOB|nr:hypothetical protein [Oceanomicrobium pacificus]MXU66408.1 hypothetical protein [Oceanomicrobium pacificus]